MQNTRQRVPIITLEVLGHQATAICVLLGRKGFGEKDKERNIYTFGYNLNFTCDEIRDTYKWGGICQDTVPQAIVAFLDGNDFEDCIRNAVSIGGDSDTLACITGSIAEAAELPEEMYKETLQSLDSAF